MSQDEKPGKRPMLRISVVLPDAPRHPPITEARALLEAASATSLVRVHLTDQGNTYVSAVAYPAAVEKLPAQLREAADALEAGVLEVQLP